MACASKTVLGEGDEDGRGRGSAGGVVHAGAAAGKLGGTSGIPATGTNGGSPSGSGAPAVGGTGGRTAGPPDVAGEGGVPTRICTNGWLDAKTGLEKCEEGYLSRPAAKRCGSPAEGSGGAGGQPSLPRASGTEPCERDADCRAFELGYCRTAQEGAGGGASRFCASGCLKDDDCGRRSICLCSPGSEHGGSCVFSDCRSNADCGEGFVCASFLDACGQLGGFACTTARDQCPSRLCGYESCYSEARFGGGRDCEEQNCDAP